MAHLEAELLEDRLLLSATLPWEGGDTPAEVREVVLSPDGFARQGRALQQQGDVALFRFTAPFTGPLQIEDCARPQSNFVTQLDLFDADGNLIPPPQFYRSGRHSVVGIPVDAGRNYYVKASAAPPSDPPIEPPPELGPMPFGVGEFELFFGPGDDAGNTAVAAMRFPGGSGKVSGVIEVPSDVDRWLYLAPTTGHLQVQWHLPQPGTGSMKVLDGAENQLPPTTLKPDGAMEFAVTAGAPYYLEMSGPAEWPADAQGSPYDLTLTLLAGPPVPQQPPPTGSENPDGSGGPGVSDGDQGADVSRFGLMAPGADFVGRVDLSRFLSPADAAPAVTGVLALPESGHALVGTLLGGTSSALGAMSAYFGSGGALAPSLDQQATETPGEATTGITTINFKIGVQDALQNRLTAARERWLRNGEESAAPDPSEASQALTGLSRLFAEELPRLGRPLGDACLSLMQQMMLMGQSLLPSETPPQPPTNSSPEDPGPESNAAPLEPATPQAQQKKYREPRPLWQMLVGLLLWVSVSQLWWPGLKRRSRCAGWSDERVR